MEWVKMADSLLDKISEAVITINTEKGCVTHFNPACHWLISIYNGMSVEELEKLFIKPQNILDVYEDIKSQIKQLGECVIRDVEIVTPSHGIQICEMRIGYLGEKEEEIYLILGYNQEDLEELYIRNRCYDIIYSNSFSYPFRLDVRTKKIQFIGPELDRFKLSPSMMDYPVSTINAGIIHEEDIGSFTSMVERMYAGEPPIHRFRVYSSEGDVLWYKVEYAAKRDNEGKLVEIVGEFINIQEAQVLENKLITDGLTGCLTKTSFQDHVERALEKSQKGCRHAMIILDVDDFKHVNDNLGHQFGDVILKDIGKSLKNSLRKTDFVGRIGGDEFMIFLQDISSEHAVIQKVHSINKLLDKNHKGKNRSYRTTVSIGVALVPENGKSFDALYNCADKALYDTKNKGKNGFSMYNTTMSDGTMRNTTPFHVASRALSQHFDHELSKDIFTLLFDSKDSNVAINKAIEMLGNNFAADRCYMFEFDENGLFNNTFEWCSEGISSHIDSLQNMTEEMYMPLFNMANEEGVIYCNDMSTVESGSMKIVYNQEIQSFLCIVVKAEDHKSVMVGFDDCSQARIWSPIEISTLMYASKMLAQFAKQRKMVAKATQTADDHLGVLEAVNAYVYIVDQDTYEIKYANGILKDIRPDIKNGDLCYKCLRMKDEPCDFCPIKDIKEKNIIRNRTLLEGFNENEKIMVNASVLESFQGAKCMLFSCSDLSKIEEK